jgi:hypothetical protein
MGLFKNLTKALKKAAPVIGGTIGFGLGGPMGAAIGSGIGGLAAGQDVEDALKTAVIGGALGYGARGMGFAPAAKGGFMPRFVGSEAAAGFGLTGAPVPTEVATQSAFNKGMGTAADKLAGGGDTGIMSALGNFAKENPLTTVGLGLGTLGLLGMTEEEEKQAERPYPKGEMFDITSRSRETGDVYQLTDPDDLAAYQREISDYRYMHGGEVNGPGTGTSDSVPARLSDGEFVVTAKAVRGAGGGDRDIGAARMYDMMAELETMA